MPNGLSYELSENAVVINNDLKISFRRTICVPDHDAAHLLQPDLGAFPLERSTPYVATLPRVMVDKGGLFFPTFQKEPMWIDFEAKNPHLIKMFVGGNNVVPGEPAIETLATRVRQQAKLARTGEWKTLSDRAFQDYVVVPQRPWADGIAKVEGTVRQFVAMPQGAGHSVEAQTTGQEITCAMQFEVSPFDISWYFSVYFKTLDGKELEHRIPRTHTIEMLKEMIQPDMRLRNYNLRLLF